MPSPTRIAAICLVLALLTLAAFWPLKNNGFINYDDIGYVTENPQVQDGLSFSGLRWAFTATVVGNWHPLTMLSHMVDWQLYGAKPAGHHLNSLIIHVINTLLLFLVMLRLTRGLWPSALVAALFALHPLHVESVAWASERKDVLSAFFWLLTMWAYLRYVERPGTWRYLPVVAFFVLGLMAKPMAVTEPFVLLLLDYWPLGRWVGGPVITAGRRQDKIAPEPGPRRVVWRLVWEKAPLLVLAAIFCAITMIIQRQSWAVISTDLLPFWPRLANALVAYVSYLGKMLWPLKLAIYYPHPLSGLPYAAGLTWWQIAGAGIFLGGVTALAMREARRFPYLPVGWFWYLGTLVPVIGLVQVGGQAMADRYTYIPLIGIFMMLAFGAADLAAGRQRRQVALAVSFGLALLACLILTWRQVGYWRDSATLFGRAVEVTGNNYLAYDRLGQFYDDAGKTDRAVEMFRQAVRLNPGYCEAYNNLGLAYEKAGRTAEAAEMFSQAIRVNPKFSGAYNNLGLIHDKAGRTDQAIEMFRRAIHFNPNFYEAHNNLGIDLADRGEIAAAIPMFQQAIRLQPDKDQSYYNLGMAYMKQGRLKEAREMFAMALQKNPGNTGAQEMLDFLRDR